MKKVKTRILSFLLALLMCLSLTPAAGAADGFSDVGTSAWYYDDVMECAGLGVVTGYEDGRFDPEGKVTSVQFIVMLTRTFYNDAVEAAKATASGSWYAPNVKVAADTGMSTDLAAIDDNPMNRYEMAVALHNVLAKNGYTPTDAQSVSIIGILPDTRTASSTYRTAVANCYNCGIISGMDNGNFEGTQTMTRAQACAVIVRMIDRIGGAEPAQPTTPTQPETPAQPQQPETPAQTEPGKTLANGKEITVENVVAILKEIEEEYPSGTTWGPSGTANNNWYKEGPGSDLTTLNRNFSVSFVYACGGWAAMVSDTIFGKSGAPAREIYSIADARPGDIVYKINTTTNTISHVAIITCVGTVNGKAMANTCDGNVDNQVVWGSWDPAAGFGTYGMTSKSGGIQYRIFTRYPEGVAE